MLRNTRNLAPKHWQKKEKGRELIPSNHIMVKVGYTGCFCKRVSHGFFLCLHWCVCVYIYMKEDIMHRKKNKLHGVAVNGEFVWLCGFVVASIRL